VSFQCPCSAINLRVAEPILMARSCDFLLRGLVVAVCPRGLLVGLSRRVTGKRCSRRTPRPDANARDQ
jgi:hypothetical protein